MGPVAKSNLEMDTRRAHRPDRAGVLSHRSTLRLVLTLRRVVVIADTVSPPGDPPFLQVSGMIVTKRTCHDT